MPGKPKNVKTHIRPGGFCTANSCFLAFKPRKKGLDRNGWPMYGGGPDNIHY